MKKQLAIAIVAILLTMGLIASPVMAFALWDGNSVQYSSHWSEGYNSITDKSVTASNQSIAIGNGIGEQESSSRLKYYRAPVPVRTSNWPAIVMGTGIREVRGISWNSADGIRRNISENFANEIKEMDSNIVIDESDDFVLVGEAPTPIKLNMRDLLKNGTRLIDESDGSALKRLSNNPKLEEKERQIELYKEGKFLVSKAIVRQSLKGGAPGCLLRNVEVNVSELTKNGTLLRELEPGISLWKSGG